MTEDEKELNICKDGKEKREEGREKNNLNARKK